MELHDHDYSVPQEHGPVVEIVDLWQFGELGIEYPGILTGDRIVGQANSELPRWRLIRRYDLKAVRSVFRQYLIGMVEVETTDDLRSDTVYSLRSLCPVTTLSILERTTLVGISCPEAVQ
jgi:hypothetical protein